MISSRDCRAKNLSAPDAKKKGVYFRMQMWPICHSLILLKQNTYSKSLLSTTRCGRLSYVFYPGRWGAIRELTSPDHLFVLIYRGAVAVRPPIHTTQTIMDKPSAPFQISYRHSLKKKPKRVNSTSVMFYIPPTLVSDQDHSELP